MADLDRIKRHLIHAVRTPNRHEHQTSVKSGATVPQALVQRVSANPQALQSTDMLYLQRAIGNSALSHLLAKGNSGIAVGAASDRFEQEAERVSQEVATHGQESSVQRSESGSESAPEEVVGAEGGSITNDLERRIERARGGGSPAPESIRRVMEEKTGSDFSEVRVHDDQEANSISSQLGARAATHGKDIFLGRGQSAHDVQLMAHELTHTVQQGAVKPSGAQSGLQKTAPSIQRELTKEQKKRIKKLKGKKRVAKVGRGALTALDWLLTLPLHVIDELSVADRHVKDFVNFVGTGQTRSKRHAMNKTTNMPKQNKRKRGNAKRGFGRTGLRGYLGGMNSHNLMYSKEIKNQGELPWNGKYNPFTQLNRGKAGFNKDIKGYNTEINQIKKPKGETTGFKMKANAPIVNNVVNDIDEPSTSSVNDSNILDGSMTETMTPDVVGEQSEALDLEWLFGNQPEEEELVND